jgi:hypothetical protein
VESRQHRRTESTPFRGGATRTDFTPGAAAIDRYIVHSIDYAAALTRKSELEADRYLRTGELASELPAEPAQIIPDRTHMALRAYRAWLVRLYTLGRYDGPTTLKRMRTDGSWETVVPLEETNSAA